MKVRYAAAAASIVTSLLHAPAVASAACMTVKESTTLSSDFVCDCSAGAAVEVQGNFAALSLGGYQVSCANTSSGPHYSMVVVRLTGQFAKLLNGHVIGHNNGVVGVAIEGLNQTVSGVTMEHCGLAVRRSAKSATITGNRIKGSGRISSKSYGPILISGNEVRNGAGIHLTGMVHNATVIDNFVADAPNCITAEASSSIFENNTVIDCRGYGIAVQEELNINYYRRAVNNTIKKNVVGWCGRRGIAIDYGDHNLVSENNVEGGIDIVGDGNVIEFNSVWHAGGLCILVKGDNNTVRGNDLKHCRENFIQSTRDDTPD